MKKIVQIIAYLLSFLLLIVLVLYIFNYDYILKGLQVVYFNGYTTAYIDDSPEFENRIIEAGNDYEPWPLHSDYNKTMGTEELKKRNKDLGTIAFLIIKNDSIWYENYAEGYGENSLTNSFSMAKSITTALLGKAIKEGSISGLEQPVSDDFPEFENKNYSPTVGDLSSMSSGLDWN